MAPPGSKKVKHANKSTRSNVPLSRTGKKRYTDFSLKDVKKYKNSSSQNQTLLNSESEESFEGRLHINANESEDFTDSEQVSRQKVDRHLYASDNEDLDETRPEHNLEDTQFGMIERLSAIERRVETLEKKLSNQAVTLLLNKNSSKSKFVIPDQKAICIQIYARDQLFRSFKYFDQNCIENVGETIYRRCLARAKMSGSEADPETLYAAVKKIIISSLTGKRGHVKDKIRDEAKGMFLLITFF